MTLLEIYVLVAPHLPHVSGHRLYTIIFFLLPSFLLQYFLTRNFFRPIQPQLIFFFSPLIFNLKPFFWSLQPGGGEAARHSSMSSVSDASFKHGMRPENSLRS